MHDNQGSASSRDDDVQRYYAWSFRNARANSQGRVYESDRQMTLEEIQKQCIEDTKEWFPELYYDMGFLTLALAGEVGELANLVKKIIRGTHDAMALKPFADTEPIHSFIYLLTIFAVLRPHAT